MAKYEGTRSESARPGIGYWTRFQPILRFQRSGIRVRHEAASFAGASTSVSDSRGTLGVMPALVAAPLWLYNARIGVGH